MDGGKMTKHEKVANIISFLAILFADDSGEEFKRIMTYDPDYIIEKFERYVLSTEIQYPRGMHTNLKEYAWQLYVDKWELQLKESE